MAVRGAKPKPLHLVQGHRTKAEKARREGVKLQPLAPDEPDWCAEFGLTSKQRSAVVVTDAAGEWRRVVPELVRSGVLAKVDRALCINWCVTWARLREAERLLTTHGLLVPGATGGTVRNPASATAIQLRQSMRLLAAELGLSPTARLRLSAGGEADDDPGGILD